MGCRSYSKHHRISLGMIEGKLSNQIGELKMIKLIK